MDVMATSFSDIYLNFSDNMSTTDYENIDITKRKSFLRTAVIEFLTNVRDVEVDYDMNEFLVDLKPVEMSLIGLYMYDEYLKQELVKANKLLNIVSDSFKITGTQDKVRNLKEFKAQNEQKINRLLATLM